MKAACAVELFAGCGGMSSGLLRAGFDVRLGIDSNASAITTYNHNHAHVGALGRVEDVRRVAGEQIRDWARLGKARPELVTGGPPCQPFSIVGKRLGLEDERGDLIFEYVRIIRELQPAGFIFENVANFAQIDAGRVADRLISKLEREGYAVSYGVLHATAFGIAQMRKRFFILGARGRREPGLPEATHGDLGLLGQVPVRTCRDVLEDLPDVDTQESLRYFNHEGTTHSAAMLKMFEKLKPGERDPKSHHDRLSPDRPSYTLRAGSGNFSPLRPIHYRYHRAISVRESARIQGFSDSFTWPDEMSRLQQYRQVGNAVPPPLAEVLGRHLAAKIGFNLDSATFGQEFKRQRTTGLSVEEQVARRQRYIRGASVGRRA